MRTNPENPTARLKPVLDEVFKFQVGEAVCIYDTLLTDEADLAINPGRYDKYESERREFLRPAPVIIIERIVQECHGGVQLMYKVHAFVSGSGVVGQATASYFEFELVSHTVAVASRKALADSKRFEAAE